MEHLPQSRLRPAPQPRPTALVICALQLEFRAVVRHLLDRHVEEDRIGTVYDVGRFDGGDLSWNVVVAECVPGNVTASQLVNAGINHFQPDIVVFVGVAGSLKDDIPLGHVVASTKIIFYPPGRADEEFCPRFNVENSHYGLVQRAKATARGDKWQERIRERCALNSNAPGATVGPIATGEQVVASELSATYALLKKSCGDALAVEMEGYGTVLVANTYGVPAIVIRSISDNVVDKTECDREGWQPVAADHAAAFLFEMLANYTPRTSALAFQLTVVEASDSLQPQVSDGKPNSLKDSVKAMSSVLLSWKTTLPSGRWIERPEQAQLLSAVKTAESSTTVLLGAPGAGKSALLAQVGRELAREQVEIFAVKADFIDANVKTTAELAAFFGLPYEAGQCIKILAGAGPVVVLIDQLDALASLLDLRSQRLNVLLNLIREVAGLRNVHIICSCRRFEYEHDIRLTTLHADEIQLELPSWDFISDLLKSHYNINSAGWPERLRESLRVPQHLNVFLSHLEGTHEHHIASSYQQLLDEIWQHSVANENGPPGRSKLLMEMARQMAAEETLWLPMARFDNRQKLVTALEAAEFLHRPAGRSTVGFRHQTLFEHALARAYATGGAQLSQHVLERQNALFVRPILWSSLRYLREVSPPRYHHELRDLCDADLRLHVTYLLIEFLGQVREPSEEELRYLQRWLEHSRFRNKALIAIAGNQGWFELLRTTNLPALMQLPTKESWSVSVVLRASWSLDRDATLSLLRDYWLPDKDRDHLTISVFRELTEWDEKVIDDVCSVIHRTDMHMYHIMDIANIVSAGSPNLAPRIIGTRLKRDLRIVNEKPKSELPPLPENASLIDYANRHLRRDNYGDYESLLNQQDGMYELAEIAEAAPSAFLHEIWPWFIEILTHLLHPPHTIYFSYRDYHGWRLDFDGERPHNSEILMSIYIAMQALAKSDVARFEEFVEQWTDFDAKPVQRLLCHGVIEIAVRDPEFALNFLTADRRRLSLGGREDRLSDSRALIRAVADRLSKEQMRQLENAILTWSEYVEQIEDEDADTRFRRLIWDREKRLRLLKTLPFERVSQETQRIIRAEESALPDYSDYDHKPSRMTLIGSPMSVDQMAKAADEDILHLFDELNDSTGAEHPRDFLRGGTEQASQELARLAERDPERVAQLIRKFRPGDQQTPVAHAIRALGNNASYPTAELFQLITELDRAGLNGPDFRGEAAQACLTRANEADGLPDEICELLEAWLDSWTDWDYFRDKEESQKGEEDAAEQSILWNREGSIYPHGSYWLVHALTYGYLRKNPPQYDKWMNVLERHIKRPESNYTWKILTEDLRYLRNYDANRSTAFLTNLFEKYPGVRDSRFGVVLITRCRFFLSDESFKQILFSVRDGNWTLGKQAFGELVGLSYIFGERLAWISEEVAKCIQQPGAIGLAYAAANLMWEDADKRQSALTLFEGLSKTSSDVYDKALMSTFAIKEGLPADSKSKQLLELINEQPRLLDAAPEHWFVEKLEDVVTYCPDLVCSICNKIVDRWAEQLANVATRTSLASSNLVNIAMTLQRLFDFRERGLALFERLLELGVYDAASLLVSLDCRPLTIPQPPRRRRRRRR